MTYTKYLDNPNRRGNVGDRDHFQHIENTLERIVPGKADAEHTHSEDDITGLSARLLAIESRLDALEEPLEEPE